MNHLKGILQLKLTRLWKSLRIKNKGNEMQKAFLCILCIIYHTLKFIETQLFSSIEQITCMKYRHIMEYRSMVHRAFNSSAPRWQLTAINFHTDRLPSWATCMCVECSVLLETVSFLWKYHDLKLIQGDVLPSYFSKKRTFMNIMHRSAILMLPINFINLLRRYHKTSQRIWKMKKYRNSKEKMVLFNIDLFNGQLAHWKPNG